MGSIRYYTHTHTHTRRTIIAPITCTASFDSDSERRENPINPRRRVDERTDGGGERKEDGVGVGWKEVRVGG